MYKTHHPVFLNSVEFFWEKQTLVMNTDMFKAKEEVKAWPSFKKIMTAAVHPNKYKISAGSHIQWRNGSPQTFIIP